MRNLIYMARRFKTATTLNLLGLCTAFATFFLLMTQVDYQLSYNHSLKDSHRLYRLEWTPDAVSDWIPMSCRPLLDIIGKMPQVEQISIISFWVGEGRLEKDGVRISYEAKATDGGTLKMLGAQPVDGEISWNDNNRESSFAVLPASLARTYFGTELVAGRRIMLDGDSVTVRGVYRDMPRNTMLGNPVVTPIGKRDKNNLQEWSYQGVVKLHEGVSAADFEAMLMPALHRGIDDFVASSGREYSDDDDIDGFFAGLKVRIDPLMGTFFSGVDKTHDKGKLSLMRILQAAAWLLIVIATINFLNFTLAESPMRIRGINTRRVLGDSLGSVRASLIIETVIISLIAFMLSLLVVAWVGSLSASSELLMGDLSLGGNMPFVVLLLAVSIAVGIVAGAYPAWFATSFAPALALKGNFGLSPSGRRLRYFLLFVQLTVSLLMACYIGVLLLQMRHVFTTDYGYAKDEVLYAALPNAEAMKKKPAIVKQLRQLAGVDGVSCSQFALGSQDQYMAWGRRDNDHVINFDCLFVAPDYFSVMGIRLKEGRQPTQNERGYVINPAARRLWTWVKMGQPVLKNDMPVLAVCDDVQFMSMRHNIYERPFAFVVLDEKEAEEHWGGDRNGVINVRCKAGTDKRELRKQIAKIVNDTLGSDEAEVHFLNQSLEELYRDELRFVRQVVVFSVACLVITLIGVFCLTMFESQYRRKEIGIRKVFGSTSVQIIAMFCRRYGWLLALSFVVAVPLAWYIGKLWLQNFAERTAIHWWLFPMSLLLVSVVTLTTVVLQSWRAANQNPVESIKET